MDPFILIGVAYLFLMEDDGAKQVPKSGTSDPFPQGKNPNPNTESAEVRAWVDLVTKTVGTVAGLVKGK